MPPTNRLARESSPYLLQHAHNPVDWYPWGPEALERARAENKPMLVSIGYAACHWCHVMERESFEDPATAALMNEYFVNIKIDREERPDLDHIYMDAVQAITGSGGWPLNVFLTPDARPFYGGTYFPPRSMHNRPSWKDVITAIHRSFQEKREEIERQAATLTEHIARSGEFGSGKTGNGKPGGGVKTDAAGQEKGAGMEPDKAGQQKGGGAWPGAGGLASLVEKAAGPFNPETLQQIHANILKTADREWGGFGHAPKFPQTFTIRFLLHYHHFTGDQEALDQACLSLDKMIAGGIYDQIGGGFARYSTDNEWLAPHFEKMLYDNALLIIVLSEAFQLTHKPRYREVIEQTMNFVRRELAYSPEEGELAFYSALDADSEGEEGKFYVWSKAEIDAALGADAPLFCRVFGVTEAGNWEGKNILTTWAMTFPDGKANPDGKAKGGQGMDGGPAGNDSGKRLPGGITQAEWEQAGPLMEKLLAVRGGRVRPALDDKVLLGWNALMNIACSKAYSALGNELYREWAVDNLRFLLKELKGRELHYFYHTYKEGRARVPAFLDDYASLTAALIHAQEITGNGDYLLVAKEITQFIWDHFREEDGPFFYFTHQDQADLILRKKEIYDGAVPSGNSLTAFNLAYMSILFNVPQWGERAVQMAEAVERLVTGYPGSFGIWATLYQALTYTIPEIVLTAKQPEQVRREFLEQFIPYRVFQSTAMENTRFPLLSGRPVEDFPLLFLCKDYACQLPVNEVNTLVHLLENVQKFSG